jgi:hypothetical protein
MYQTQHVIGISQHPIAPWVKDLVGQMPHGSSVEGLRDVGELHDTMATIQKGLEA